MGANYRKHTGRAPRSDYSARKLIPANSSSSKERFYGKGKTESANDNAKDESLPEGWSILEPNRVKERRLAAGYPTVDSLAMKIGTMSYQRLHKIESGIVVVRDSEYELIARTLEMPVSMLKLPMLMHSETVQWMKLWGKEQRLEEGGDHDAVLLAAYVRYHARKKDLNKAKICKFAKVNANAMHYIWHAAKPIDRYPDTTMMATMMLTENSSWDNVILDSRAYYAAGLLTEEIKKVQKPRVRYAPEDPDKRAPWTYDVDPFRERQPRSQYINAYTSDEAPGRSPIKLKALADRRRHVRRLIQFFSDAKTIHQIVKRDDNPWATLLDYYPKGEEAILSMANVDTARITLHRLMCVKYLQANGDLSITPLSHMLGITHERLRQMKNEEPTRGIKAVMPKADAQYHDLAPDWSKFRSSTIKKAA